VVLTVPDMLICSKVEQSVTVAVQEDEDEEDFEVLEGSVLVGSSLFGSRSLTGGTGLLLGLLREQKKLH